MHCDRLILVIFVFCRYGIVFQGEETLHDMDSEKRFSSIVSSMTRKLMKAAEINSR